MNPLEGGQKQTRACLFLSITWCVLLGCSVCVHLISLMSCVWWCWVCVAVLDLFCDRLAVASAVAGSRDATFFLPSLGTQVLARSQGPSAAGQALRPKGGEGTRGRS